MTKVSLADRPGLPRNWLDTSIYSIVAMMESDYFLIDQAFKPVKEKPAPSTRLLLGNEKVSIKKRSS